MSCQEGPGCPHQRGSRGAGQGQVCGGVDASIRLVWSEAVTSPRRARVGMVSSEGVPTLFLRQWENGVDCAGFPYGNNCRCHVTPEDK